jgi:hypothetical protein
MTFRFQRRVTIFPGVRLNFSKRGTSVSVGARGADMNFGRSGATANVGLPGTGIRWTQKVCLSCANRDRHCDQCGGTGSIPRELPHWAGGVLLALGAIVLIGVL